MILSIASYSTRTVVLDLLWAINTIGVKSYIIFTHKIVVLINLLFINIDIVFMTRMSFLVIFSLRASRFFGKLSILEVP
jgi:hypothetical protein